MNRRDFAPVEWDAQLVDDCRHLIRLAVREDLYSGCDLTTSALVPAAACGSARIVARQSGIVAGILVAQLVLDEMEIKADWETFAIDGQAVEAGTDLARLTGSARDLLTAERTMLNFLGRLCGIATQTRRYVDAIQGTPARLYDTRKTTPGWRRLEKYAVRMGGGWNHRTGLFDAVLIKDNHLSVASRLGDAQWTPAKAVLRAREFLQEWYNSAEIAAGTLIEVEVDSLDQLLQVLPANPDVVLLDNMSVPQLQEAVRLRNQAHSSSELEASGGINLATIRGVAETGVERISAGALTHAAVSLDVALDWEIG